MQDNQSKKVLVLTSTFPRWINDSEPAFVEYLSLQLAKRHQVHILAPHTKGAMEHEVWPEQQKDNNKNLPTIEVFRFRYFPESGQTLAYNGGIMANLDRNPFKYGLVPLFMLSQLFWIMRLHRQHQYDVIHAHWIIPQGLLSVLFNLNI